MPEEGKKDVRLETTLEAVREAKTLIRTARSAALATVEPGTGWPIASRVGLSTDIDGTPIILTSRLAAHTPALLADPRCSLLVGNPGKGDPLAHPRLSIACRAREVERDSAEHRQLDNRYLMHQQKARLYSSLGDFRYFRLEVQSASFNAGFGRAYALKAADLINANPANTELAAAEPDAIEHMNDDHAEAIGLYAEHFAKAPAGAWRLIGVDAEGMELADGDDIRRVWFDTELTSSKDMHMTLVRMAGEARQALGRPLKDARPASSR
jgi:putative heme iron utilization protein